MDYGTKSTNYSGQTNYSSAQTGGLPCAWRPGMACNGACGARCRIR